MIEVDISTETAERLSRILEGVENAEEKVLRPALSRGLTAGKTALNKQIKEVYSIATNKLSSRYARYGYKSIGVEGDKIIGSLEFSGGVIPLYKFEVSPSEVNNGKVRKQVTAAVLRGGGGETLENAFIGEMGSGHMGVFERSGQWKMKKRNTRTGEHTGNNEKIKQLFGPSLAGMAGKAVEYESVEARVNEVINKRIQHELDRLLSNGG